jgi:hypothetical protein
MLVITGKAKHVWKYLALLCKYKGDIKISDLESTIIKV